MTSAQVLSNAGGSSGKQGHLEAGKRRLEEFRKKKAAAKKSASTSHSHNAKSTAYEKQASETGESHINQLSATADGSSETAKTSGFLNHDDKLVDVQQMELKQEGNSSDILSLKSEISFVHLRRTDDQVGNAGSTGDGRYVDGTPSSNSAIMDNNSYYHSKFYSTGESLSNKDVVSYETLNIVNAHVKDTAASVYPEGHATTNLRRDKSDSVHPTVDLAPFASELSNGQHADLHLKNDLTSGLKERNTFNAAGNLPSFYNPQASKPISGALNSDVSSSFDVPLYSVVAETDSRRSRTSFIDSLNIGSDSRAPGLSSFEKPASTPVEPPPKPASPPSVNYFGNAYREQKLFGSMENNLESKSLKQNEDFAALEQHIEDLTQEKFSLQRVVDASKSLAESLASENSSLTESYNQQASIMAELKSEMERLQGEIKARLVELESIKAEYMNVQLECNAADERAKLLASEVIGLEQKALRLRSNELKLERELQNSSTELASYKKKLSSLEKERQDMVQKIDALREEKKVLHSKLRRASACGISVDMNQGHPKKDASTCTNDLGLGVGEADRDNSDRLSSDLQEHDGADNLSSLAMHRPADVEDAATTFPPDQVQMILNIDSLISEIRAEKEEIVKALVTERSTSTKLKDLNKELSQKLEAQTQRLELLTAKSMASANVVATQPTGPRAAHETVAYADEGDEVVERVLGWIIKLFPGGPSKRRTSRL